jgi:uncharacterized protein YqgC (DUF456 family)
VSADLAWTALIGLVMVVGLCGVVIPVLPGLTVIWLAALGYGFAVGWGPGGVAVLVVLSLLLGTSLVAGVVVPRRAAAGGGASGLAQLGGVVGAIVGFFLIPVVGVVVGALVGVLAAELAIQRDWTAAWTATRATARGFGVSAAIDLGLGLAMIAVWSAWAATVIF